MGQTEGPGGLPGRPAGGYLAVTADGLPTLLTGVGVERLEAGHAVGALLPQDVLLSKERLIAVVAVKALCHVDTRLLNSLQNTERTQASVGALRGPRTQSRHLPPSVPVFFFSQRVALFSGLITKPHLSVLIIFNYMLLFISWGAVL